MSSYIERLCSTHGEWQMDVDNIGECPTCEKQGLLEIQQLRAEIESLRQQLAASKEIQAAEKKILIAEIEKNAAANATICGLREGLQAISKQLDDPWSKFVAVKTLGDAFSFPPTCQHKERALTQEALLQRAGRQLADLQAQLAEKNRDVDAVLITLNAHKGWENECLKLQAELTSLQEVARAADGILGVDGYDTETVRIARHKLRQAILSHESKWGKVEKPNGTFPCGHVNFYTKKSQPEARYCQTCDVEVFPFTPKVEKEVL